MLCPRREELGDPSTFKLPAEDEWRPDGTCSHCGSISQEELFRVIESGGRLDPTDKNYKVYVNDANPNVGKPRIVGIASHKPDDSWVEVTAENLTTFPDYKRHPLEPGTWVLVAPDSAARMRKFYFQHLDVDGRKRLIGLVNAKTINFGEPGYFYPLPFFMKIAEPEATQPTEVPK
jgi:hypothetical protein